MDHHQAIQSAAAEKYLLDELAPEARGEFEEHFFDCRDCATDLRAAAGFMDAARDEFKANPMGKPAVSVSKRRFALHGPVAVWSALAASLLVIAYQNVAVFPRLNAEVAELRAPEILPSLSLVGSNSRGGQMPAIIGAPNKPFLLLLDLPTQDRFSSYTCLLYSPSGSLVWRVAISAQLAKDTVSIRVPSASPQSGKYSLLVQGNGAPGVTAVELARYPFTLERTN